MRNAVHAVHSAMNVARKSTMRHQHGCVIARRGKIIASGYNRHTPDGFSIHAEIMALNNCKNWKLLNGAVMYVVRLKFQDKCVCGTKLSKPCAKCQPVLRKFIDMYGLRKVYYSVYNINEYIFNW